MYSSPAYHSRIHQSPVYRSLPGISGGEVSTGALKFDGVDDYVRIPHSPLFNFSNNIDFTLAFWVKDIGDTTAILMDKRDSAGRGWFFIYYVGDLWFYIAGTTGTMSGTGLGALPTKAWSHLALVVQRSGVASLYVNGVFRANTGSVAGVGVADNSKDITIGSQISSNALAGNVVIDDVRIYNVALTAAQVQAMYENQTPAPTAGLVAHYKFDDGSGTTAADSSGNGNTGTLTNGPTWQVQVPPRLSRNRLTEDWSVAFDGNDDYIVAATTGINFANPYSISFWYKYNVSTAGMGLLSVATDGSVSATPNILIQSNSNTLRTYDPVNGYHDVAPTVAGQWYHVVVTRSPTQETVYVNGVNTSSSTCGTNNNTAYLYIGSGYYARTNGNIKDVRIYNTALAQADITKLCNGQESTAVPVAQWRLNDGSGTTAVNSKGTGNGTLTNGPTWSGDVPQWHRPIVDSTHAAVFDGVDDYISVVNSLGRNATSVSFWFNLAAAGSLVGIFSYGDSRNDGNPYWLIQNHLAGGYLRIYDYAAGYLNVTSAISLGRWYHYYETRVGGVGRVYVNGELKLSFSAFAGGNYSNVYFGSGFSSPLNGQLDDVRIFNRALTAAEVLDLFQGYTDAAGLVGHWKLDNNYNDSVGSNNGTESGGVTFTTGVPGTL